MSESERSRIQAQSLSLETIPLVDGGVVGKQFDALLSAAIHDCSERQALDKTRKVTLDVLLTPVLDQRGVFDHVDVDFSMSSKVPGYNTGFQPMHMRGHGGAERLIFQPLSPDDPRQDPLPNIDGPGASERIDRNTGEVLDDDDE